MYSKLVCGLAVAASVGLSQAADIVRRDTSGGGGHGHDHGHAPAPSSGYDEPAAGYSAPSAGYGAPSAGYGAPAASYGAPSAGYGAPDTGYGTPDAGYAAPATGYAEPSYGGSAPSYGGDSGNPLDFFPFSFLIIPLLIIAGLSLLFPTITSVAARKKRDTGKSTTQHPQHTTQ